jgi:hypothetical protein
MRGVSRTGAPAATSRLTTNGTVTTTSSDGFISPPIADQMSAIERSGPSGRATVTRAGIGCSERAPCMSAGARTSNRMSAPRQAARSRCSSSGRCVQAVRR